MVSADDETHEAAGPEVDDSGNDAAVPEVDESGSDAGTPEGDEADDSSPRPSLQQRFSPVASVTTTVHAEGLVIEVRRLFRQRTVAVGFERLVLDPSSIVSLRPGLLWTAGALCATGLLTSLLASPAWAGVLPVVAGPAHGGLRLLAPLLLVGGVLVLLAAVSHPRRITLFLDREAGLHPSFLRDGPHEADAEAFVQLVRRAIIDFRCRPPESDDEESAPAPRLASTLDSLLSMQHDELLSAPELAYFSELAQRR